MSETAIIKISVSLILFIGATFIFFALRYKMCPSDKILVIFGIGPGMNGRTVKTLHGGGALIWPLVQDYTFLDLKPMTIEINLTNALSNQNIRINVLSIFTLGVSTQPVLITNAAERLLGLTPQSIEDMAEEIIFSQLRLVISKMTVEDIHQNSEAFLDEIQFNVNLELNEIGLHLINVNILDITDMEGIIESMRSAAVVKPAPAVGTVPASRAVSFGNVFEETTSDEV